MRRNQRVDGEAWRIRATSGVGASELALPRSLRRPRSLLLRDVVVYRCCFFNHRRYTTTLSPKLPPPPPTMPHRRRSYCCCCCCAAAVVLRLRLVSRAFVSKKKTGCSVVVMIVVIELGRAAVSQFILRGHRHLRPRRRCCCCCSHSRVRVFQKCFVFVVAGDPCCAVRLFVEFLLQTQPNACRSEYGLFQA